MTHFENICVLENFAKEYLNFVSGRGGLRWPWSGSTSN